MREHFEKLKDFREQLVAMGKSISDDEFALILMGSLPPLYQLTLSGIAAAAEISAMTPSAATVTKLAVDEYDRCTLDNGKTHDQAFAADAQMLRYRRNVRPTWVRFLKQRH